MEEEEEQEAFLGKEVEKLNVDGPTDDDITRAIGAWGRWQTYIFTVIFALGFFSFTHIMVFSFFVPEAEHWCAPPELFSNWTSDSWKGYSIPPSKEEAEKLSECFMYDRDYSVLPEDGMSGVSENASKVACKYGWQYDRSQFTVTIENEWDLVCEKELWAKTAASTYNAGFLVGVVVSGQISDIYGRTLACRICMVIATVTAFLVSIVPSFEVFCFVRFFVAAGLTGATTVTYVMFTEIVDSSLRAVLSVVLGASGSFGYVLLTVVAYYLPNWRMLNLAITVPILLCVPFIWVLPESIRWLISQKRYGEAYRIMQKAAKVNKKAFPSYDDFSFSEETESSAKVTMIDLFRYSNLRSKTMNLYFNWFVVSFMYYGISLGMNSLGGSVYINSFVSGAVEIPAGILSYYTMTRIGRKWSICLYMVGGGIACMVTAFFEKGVYTSDWPIVTLAMVGKFCVSASFGVIYLFSAETFPTVARNVGIGSSSMCARIGSIIAPYIDLLRHFHSGIPLVLYGITGVAAGLLVLLMPETLNKPIPESIEEAERAGRKISRTPKTKTHLPSSKTVKNFLGKKTLV